MLISAGTRGAEEEKKKKEHKDMPRQHLDLASRRARTHARNANTNTKHDFPVGGVTKDSPPQPPKLI